MNQYFKYSRSIIMTLLTFIIFSSVTFADEFSVVDSCSLIDKDEIRAAFGQRRVSDGVMDVNIGTAIGGNICKYSIGDRELLSIWIKTLTPDKAAEKQRAEETEKSKTSDAPGLGDHSYFINSRKDYTQLVSFKGNEFIIIGVLIHDSTDVKRNTVADKLMRIILTRL